MSGAEWTISPSSLPGSDLPGGNLITIMKSSFESGTILKNLTLILAKLCGLL